MTEHQTLQRTGVSPAGNASGQRGTSASPAVRPTPHCGMKPLPLCHAGCKTEIHQRFLKSKVCGLTRPQDVALCHALGVDYTGFIFAENSPRRVSPQAAAALPRGISRRVGVFAGASVSTVLAIAREAGLDYLQLHGGEDEAFCRAVGPERVIKVLWPERHTPASLMEALERFAPVCACFLLDAGAGGGGNGTPLDWAALRSCNPPRPWFLAGAMGPRTLPQALGACSPDGVDMNSALESAPGVKDAALLHAAMAMLCAR